MKRTPANHTTVPEYPSVTDIERDRRGFLRLFGKILAGVLVMGPLSRAALAEDKPKPVKLGGKVKPPDPAEIGGRLPAPVEPPDVGCDPEKDDCDEKDPPRHPGTKRPPDPPAEIRRGGEMPATKPPTRVK